MSTLAEKICASCGATGLATDRVCVSCGTPFPRAAPAYGVPPTYGGPPGYGAAPHRRPQQPQTGRYPYGVAELMHPVRLPDGTVVRAQLKAPTHYWDLGPDGTTVAKPGVTIPADC